MTRVQSPFGDDPFVAAYGSGVDSTAMLIRRYDNRCSRDPVDSMAVSVTGGGPARRLAWSTRRQAGCVPSSRQRRRKPPLPNRLGLV
jgi:hypothetical protein